MRLAPVFLAVAAGLVPATAMADWLAPPEERAPIMAPNAGDPEIVSDEIVVDLKDDVSDGDVADVARTYGLTLRPNSAWSDAHDRFELARVPAAAREALLARLARDPRVENAEAQSLLWASFVPNDPLYAEKQWHLKRVGAERAWEFGCGLGVTVAVIDTGVACYDKNGFSKGTDLAGTRCGGGYNFVADSTDAYDDHGHGTHVAGTIAQTTHNGKGVAGLAHCATLMPVKVLSKQGFGTVANVAEGIRFAADNGAQVINMSLGGPIKSKILEDAVQHALKKGVVVVAAAGNSGRSVGYPAAYPGVIAVSATDGSDKIAWFSSRGPQIVLGAPGVSVTQQTVCDGGKNHCEIFGTFNGTSMASPHVAGVAALLVGEGITDATAVRGAMEATARAKGDKELYGAGIVDGGAAIARAHWWHLALRAIALLALGALVAHRIRKKQGALRISAGAVGGALLFGVGLLPIAPLLRLTSHLGGARAVGELLSRPVGEWDLLLGAGLHRYLPLANALPVLALTGLFFQVKRLRPFVGGAALGTAAFLGALALQGDVATFGGPVVMRIWVLLNAAVALWVARVALDKKSA